LKIINYSFHDLLKVRIVLRNATPFNKYLEETFRYYQVDEISSADLTFFLDNFSAQKDGCKSKGDFLVKKNYIYHRFKHKINMMEIEIDGIEDNETIVRINSGWLNTIRAIGHVLSPFIRFKLIRKGYPALFISCVAGKNGAIVLSAKGHTGKTTMVLWAIKHGFSFLGDGTVILGRNKVYNFIVPLNLFANHFPIVKDSLSLKACFTLLCNKVLYLLSDKKHKLFARINVTDISRDCVVKESLPTYVCLLERRGDKLVIEHNIDNTTATKEMVSIHKSTDGLMTRILSAYTSVFTNSELVNYWTNLELEIDRCLEYAKFHRITFPESYSLDIVSHVYDKVYSEAP